MAGKYLNKIVKTEMGFISRKEYIDKCISFKALFWKSEKEGIKKIRYFIGFNKNTLEINKSMFDYAISKIDYKMDFCLGHGI